MTDSAPAALQVQSLGVSFSGVRALDDVSFSIPNGGVSAVIGPNGAGKTTLFNCISGVARHGGRVLLHGEDLSGLRADQRSALGIARTFQTPLLINELSPIENVMLGAHPLMRGGVFASLLRSPALRRGEREQRDAAADLLHRLGVDRPDVQRVDGLPHGDRRRVEVARALIAKPRLLLLDEPAAGLGAQEAVDLIADVQECGSEIGTTCILVEHDVALVMSVSKHVVVLDAGRLLMAGGSAEVAADPRVIAAYLGDDWSEAA
jgi:branched-chain amino acid transport system ATP-binding protein